MHHQTHVADIGTNADSTLVALKHDWFIRCFVVLAQIYPNSLRDSARVGVGDMEGSFSRVRDGMEWTFSGFLSISWKPTSSEETYIISSSGPGDMTRREKKMSEEIAIIYSWFQASGRIGRLFLHLSLWFVFSPRSEHWWWEKLWVQCTRTDGTWDTVYQLTTISWDLITFRWGGDAEQETRLLSF